MRRRIPSDSRDTVRWAPSARDLRAVADARRTPEGVGVVIRSTSRAMAFGFALAVTTGSFVATARALPQQPGPAPIVVTGSGSEPVRVSQGGRERVVAPATTAPMIAQSTAGDSAFDVPEQVDDSVGAQGFGQAVDPPGDEVASESGTWTDRPSGYQPSSELNRNLPGATSSPFSKGYAPSSSLNERMAAQASSQMTAWPAGEATGVVTVQQWSTRGSASRRGSR